MFGHARKIATVIAIATVLGATPVYAEGIKEVSKPAEWAQESITSLDRVDFFRFSEFLDDYQQPITRSEYAVLVTSLYEVFRGEIDYNDAERFTDLKDNPYTEEIGKASGYNLVTGATYRQYRSDELVTREWAATYTHRLLAKMGYIGKVETQDIIFSDMYSVSNGCLKSVEYMVANGFMSGVGNEIFNPNGIMTREQAYTMAWRVYSQMSQ